MNAYFSQTNALCNAPQLVALNQERSWIEAIRDLVKNSLQETKISVEDLADTVHLSPRQLHRKIKALTGMSPVKFIQEIQLEVAREELEKGGMLSLGDLAFKCGFEYQGYFSTMFRNRFGISPREYWKSSLKQAS
jgi:AraC-like DNA-binding protein